MATYRSGANSRIVIGKEPTFNTADPTPVGHVLRKASFTFNGIQERIQNPELRSDTNPARTIAGRDRVTARLTMPLTTDELGLIMTLFNGTYTVTGTSAPYTHKWVNGSTDPSSCWVEVGDTALTKYCLFNGLVVRSISFGTIDKASSGLVMVTVDFFASGKHTLNAASPQDASPDTYSNQLHPIHKTSVKSAGSTTAVISQCSLTLSRTITGYGVLDNTAYDSEVDRGKYVVDCTVTGWRDSADTLFGLANGVESSFELISERSGDSDYTVSVSLGEVDYLRSEESPEVGDGPVLATVRVEPYYINDADAGAIVVTIMSDVADYAACW